MIETNIKYECMYKQFLIKFERKYKFYWSPLSLSSRSFDSSCLLFRLQFEFRSLILISGNDSLNRLTLLLSNIFWGFIVIVFIGHVFVVLIIILRDSEVVIFCVTFNLLYCRDRLGRAEVFGEILFAFFLEVSSYLLWVFSVPDGNFSLWSSSS